MFEKFKNLFKKEESTLEEQFDEAVDAAKKGLEELDKSIKEEKKTHRIFTILLVILSFTAGFLVSKRA